MALMGLVLGSKLDKITSGWQKSDMMIVRPGMGKTAFVLSMARNVAVDYEHPVAIFFRNEFHTIG